MSFPVNQLNSQGMSPLEVIRARRAAVERAAANQANGVNQAQFAENLMATNTQAANRKASIPQNTQRTALRPSQGIQSQAAAGTRETAAPAMTSRAGRAAYLPYDDIQRVAEQTGFVDVTQQDIRRAYLNGESLLADYRV